MKDWPQNTFELSDLGPADGVPGHPGEEARPEAVEAEDEQEEGVVHVVDGVGLIQAQEGHPRGEGLLQDPSGVENWKVALYISLSLEMRGWETPERVYM